MFSPTIPPSAAAGAALLLVLIFLFRRRQRLRHIPGPFWASLTDLWLFAQTKRGVYYNDMIRALHAQYGPVVRWGPSRVSFASSAAVADIYHAKQPFPKAPSYEPMIVVASGKQVKTLITERDEKRVSALKRHMVAGFSQSSFLRQEPQIDRVMARLFALLREKVGRSKGGDEKVAAAAAAAAAVVVVDISKILPGWSFDTINQVAFTDDLGFVAADGADLGGTFEGVKQRFDHWRTWFALPTLERLIYKNPYARRFPPSKSILGQLAMRRVEDRKQDEDKDGLDKDLLGRFLAASYKDPEALSPSDVLGLTISTIHAGSHTISSGASLMLMNLIQHPDKMDRLVKELDEAGLSKDAVPLPFDAVANLPYLDAVLREGLRYNDSTPNPREKTITSGGGATISGTFVPGGTDVSVSDWHVHHDESLWGDDAHLFRPERWMEASQEQRRAMDKAHMGFSQGRRVCIGQHLARIEIKKLLASLLVTFKVTASNEEPSFGFHMNTLEVSLKVNMEFR